MFIAKARFYYLLIAIALLTLLFSVEAQAATSFPDTQGHWGEKPIQALLAKEVLNGYPDGSFKPDQAITRAEFAKLISRLYGYQPVTTDRFPDTGANWAKTYINSAAAHQIFSAFPDGTFQPNGPVSRAKLTSIITKVLQLATPEEKYSQAWAANFTDVPSDYWGFRSIEIANKLGLLPANYQSESEFHPQQAVTRAEAVWMVKALSDLVVTKGLIQQVDPDTGLVNLDVKGKDEPFMAMVTPETILLRNNVSNDIDSLLSGDQITVIALPSGEVKFLKSVGRPTKNDLVSKVSSMTKGYLTPELISSMVAGDWQMVKDDLKGGLYNRLIDLGITPSEAESIMVQDWNYLDSLSRDRLAQAFSNLFGITQDFSQALLARDVPKIKEYGKIELATAALSKLLGVNNQQSNTQDSQY